jgi:excisionase family DNA binding protein
MTITEIERETITVKELAGLLGVSAQTAYEYLVRGAIPAQKLGKKWIISRKVVLRWLENSPAVPISRRA